MTAAVYHAKLAQALERAGGLYALPDLLERIADGRMQSFTWNNSWVVTQVCLFPRARTLQVVALAGDLADGENLHEQVLGFARKIDADAIVAQGRDGWAPLAKAHGWAAVSRNTIFMKGISHERRR